MTDKDKTVLLPIIRTRFRRDANIADNKAAPVAVDSLINYEAVKVRLLRWTQIKIEFDHQNLMTIYNQHA